MIRVFVVDEAHLMCNMISAVLQSEPDIEVVGSAIAVKEALGRVKNERCDVILVSTRLPADGALELTRALSRNDYTTKVLVMGAPESHQTIIRYIEAGASGYVLRDHSVEELMDNIRDIYGGRAHISPEVALAIMSRLSELAQLCHGDGIDLYRVNDLTRRQYEILDLIGRGLSNQEIAERLSIEVGTVKNHVHNILKKLNVNNRQDAASYLNAAEANLAV